MLQGNTARLQHEALNGLRHAPFIVGAHRELCSVAGLLPNKEAQIDLNPSLHLDEVTTTMGRGPVL